MEKINVDFEGVLNNMQFRKEGTYRIEFVVSLNFIAKVLSLVRLLNTVFVMKISHDADVIAGISTAIVHRILVDKEGESKVMFEFEYDKITEGSMANFGGLQEELLTIIASKAETGGEDNEQVEQDKESSSED